MLCEKTPDALIVHADGTNQRSLIEEGIEHVDAVITLTGMDETNIIVSSFVKNLNNSICEQYPKEQCYEDAGVGIQQPQRP